MKLTFHPEAEAELREAVEFYHRESPLTAKRFRDEVKSLTRRIVLTPQQFPEMSTCYRRALVSGFPYAIFFDQTPQNISILAVAHSGRFPGYWRERLLPPT